jgi:hypothetical protein
MRASKKETLLLLKGCNCDNCNVPFIKRGDDLYRCDRTHVLPILRICDNYDGPMLFLKMEMGSIKQKYPSSKYKENKNGSIETTTGRTKTVGEA